MCDIMAHDLWEFAKAALYVILYSATAFFVIKLSHSTIKELFSGFGSELKSFAKLDPNIRTLNMLFGILIFAFVILVIGAMEIAEVQHRETAIPPAIMMLIGMFWLTVFFSLCVAFCNKVQK
jgi:hypothetical protein